MTEKSLTHPASRSPVREALTPDNSTPAERALAEAEARRAKAAEAASLAPEINGPAGAEPTRFGDWERKGIAYDF